MNVMDIARPGSRWSKATVAIIVEQFKIIRKHNRGKLTAALVLEHAKDPANPLHRFFEWDDSKAAERWRTEQARHLISEHYVLVTTDSGQIISRAAVVVEDAGSRSYKATVDVLRDEVYSQQVLDRAKAEMKSWIARYEGFKELRGAVMMARKVIRSIR